MRYPLGREIQGSLKSWTSWRRNLNYQENRIRRALGLVFVVSGLLHSLQAGLVLFYSLGLVHLHITARLWSRMHYGLFLFTVLAGGSFLFFSFRRAGLFYAQTLLDFAVGIGIFVLLVSLLGLLLGRHPSPWIALLPSAFLLAYGLGLYRGRSLGFWARNPEE